jgi:H+/Na+-translocating ferredoxin:NAD+ oxidoreductase subunit C
MRFFGGRSFAHGIYLEDYKKLTSSLPIRRLPFAPQLIIPLSQHAGAPALPLVKPGQEVLRGEPIAAANGFVSVPVHAPATGIVEDIRLMPTARGPKTESIVLHVYEASNQEVLYAAPREKDAMTAEEIIQAVQDAGMVGLGGAAFPSHVKMRPPPEHQVDTLVVNGCECEPYLTCDHRLMLEQPEQLLVGIQLVMRAMNIHRAVIGVEDNKMDAIEVISARLPNDGSISIQSVASKYPQGAEKMLIESLLQRRVPPGEYPSAVGVSVFNVGTLAQIGELLPLGGGVIDRIVTVTGQGVKHPGNYLTPVGTPVRFLLQYAGSTPGAYELILGGPMMGMSVASLDVPVTKAVSGMVVQQQLQEFAEKRHELPCIHCAWCVDACPMYLNPSMLGLLAIKAEYTVMANEYHLNDCFECGCCSYICPANIPLVHHFRIAKSVNRDKAA